MILEDEEDADLDFPFESASDPPLRGDLSYNQLILGTLQLENQETHFSLRGDLIEHLWALKGSTARN